MISVYLVGTALWILFVGAFYQGWATRLDDDRHSPPGQLIDTGQYRMHLHTSGEGAITVLLDAGLGGTSLGWSLVQSEVAKFTRVCSFDRPGYGWSDRAPSARTSLHIAQEVHTLLEKADIPPPYLLVGHSFGGCNMLMLADLYPEETLGVILVDSVHEDMLKELPSPPQGVFDALMSHPQLHYFLSLIGYKRIKGPSLEIQRMLHPLPEDVQKSYIAQMNKARYTETVHREMEALKASLGQLSERKVHLQHKPLVVITAGILPDGEEGKSWRQLQNRLLSKSTRAQQIMAENSDHMINHHQPDVIVEAIRAMMETLTEALPPPNSLSPRDRCRTPPTPGYSDQATRGQRHLPVDLM